MLQMESLYLSRTHGAVDVRAGFAARVERKMPNCRVFKGVEGVRQTAYACDSRS